MGSKNSARVKQTRQDIFKMWTSNQEDSQSMLFGEFGIQLKTRYAVVRIDENVEIDDNKWNQVMTVMWYNMDN
jgi:hypothetical protein